jgi:hypothetical protein
MVFPAKTAGNLLVTQSSRPLRAMAQRSKENSKKKTTIKTNQLPYQFLF